MPEAIVVLLLANDPFPVSQVSILTVTLVGKVTATSAMKLPGFIGQ